MQTLRNTLLTLLFAMLLVAGCEHADPLDPNRLEPTLSSIQANIFNLNCTFSGCHVGGSPVLPGVMNLRAGQAYANIVNVPSLERANLLRVAPGDPENSYLVMKIEGRAGPRMPLNLPALSAEEIAVIRQWIADGAPDN